MTGDRGNFTSASNAESDELCPGRHAAQQGLDEPPATDYSDSGTVVHALWTDSKPQRDPTDEETEKALELAYREGQIAGENGFDATKCHRLTEQRLWWRSPDKQLQHSGRFDVAWYDSPSRLLILDGKSGWSEVPPPNTNRQLRRLAALAFYELAPSEVLVNIIRPFGKQEPCCRYDADDLQQAFEEMVLVVRASHDSRSPRIPGAVQCKYCRAAYHGTCKEHAAWIASSLPTVQPPLPTTPAKDWTPSERARFCERWKTAEKWGNERWDEIRELLKAEPQAVPGFTLKDGTTRETITNPAEVHSRFCGKLVGGATEDFMPAVSIAKGKLKDAVREVTGQKGKALDSTLQSLLRGCTESTQAEPTIVRVK